MHKRKEVNTGSYFTPWELRRTLQVLRDQLTISKAESWLENFLINYNYATFNFVKAVFLNSIKVICFRYLILIDESIHLKQMKKWPMFLPQL